MASIPVLALSLNETLRTNRWTNRWTNRYVLAHFVTFLSDDANQVQWNAGL